jgi:hypothetical protein
MIIKDYRIDIRDLWEYPLFLYSKYFRVPKDLRPMVVYKLTETTKRELLVNGWRD